MTPGGTPRNMSQQLRLCSVIRAEKIADLRASSPHTATSVRREGCGADCHVMLHVMEKNDSARQSVQRYRDRMRRAGLRLVQLWVPDTRTPGFAQECHRQSRVAAKNRRAEDDVMTWVEETRDTDAWTR